MLLGFRGKLLVASFIVLAFSCPLFGGKEFLAGPRDQVAANQLLVGLKLGADINKILSALAPQAAASVINAEQNTYLLKLPPGLQAVVSKLLAAHPLVNYVEPNRIRGIDVLPPNDPQIGNQWNLTNINALQAWSYFPDGYLTAAAAGANRVKVAILDTGVDCTHPDFMNAGGTSTDAAQGGQLLWASSVAIYTTTVASPACPWQDDNGHGTHTAGILAAATGNATGVASLGFPLQLIVIKTNDENGNASDYQVAEGIYDAINAGAQVVSMSLGGPGYSQTLQTAMDYAWAHNVLVVSAAGNTGNAELVYPGAGNHGLGVGATDNNNNIAGFSTFGNWAKIAAPGVGILSTLPTYNGPAYCCNYGALEGTSMATPHVAALAGLLFAANPGISAAAVAQRIQQTAQSPNTGWSQYIGYGVIDAGAALGNITGAFTQGALTGQVTDPYGNPLTGAIVTAGGQSFTTATDTISGADSGLFRLNLNPGTYSVSVTMANYSTVNVQAAVVAGADTMLTIQMGGSSGEFSGTVTHNGVAVAGAVVEAVSAGGALQGTAISDSSGNYAVYVIPGPYTLTGTAPNYISSTSGSQTLSAGGSITVNLALNALGNIVGTVSDLNGIPVANAHIDFTNSSFTGGAFSATNGTYSTYGIPAGTYTVTASASGYTSVSIGSVSVSTNISTLINFQFSTGIAPTNGLLANFPFNEGSGSTANDLSGNGYNAALTNTTWTAGLLYPYALSFNGSNSSGTTPAMPFTNKFSVSVWVNPASPSPSSWSTIVQAQSGSWWLGIDQSGSKYKFTVNSGTGSTGDCAYSYVEEGCTQIGPISTGWHMLTGTYDGAAANLYLDGVLVATDTATAKASASSNVGMGSYWNGALQSLRIYDRTLTASEVSTLFSQPALLNLTKTADAATVSAGSSIGFTLAVSNSGSGAATSTNLTDALPAGTGIAWSVSPSYSGPGTCAITGGNLSCSIGSLSPGSTASVHVTSATTTGSCGAYPNTASASATNAGTVQASATTAVRCTQTIAFNSLSNQVYGTAPFTMSASATSGLAVSFNSSTTLSVCTVSGNTVTIIGGGTCTIQATQSGNTYYSPAAPVSQSFTVTSGSQSIAFNALSNRVYGAAPFTLSATATSGLAVSFNSSTTLSVCTVSGSTVTIVNGGMCTVQATQAGNANYSAATAVSQSFTVTAASQSITFNGLSNQPYGAAPFTVSATATSGLAVSFNSSTTLSVCTTSGNTVTIVGGGTCTVQATQTGNANYSAATPVSQSFTVTSGSQSITFNALSNQVYGAAPFTVSATATSGLAVSFNSSTTLSVCTTSGNTVTIVAGGTCTIQATQSGNTFYSAATPVSQSFTVTQASQSIAFSGLSSQVYGAAPFTVSATATSGLPVSFNSSSTLSVCTMSGNTVTIAGGGTCTVQATQSGNATYSAATPASQSFTVTPAAQTIAFAALPSQSLGSAPFPVNATSSSNLAVSFNSSTTLSVCTVSGNTVTLVALGGCTIQATQSGNTNYSAATPVSQSFTVTSVSQTITFNGLSSRVYGAAPFTVTASATSGLPVTFNSSTTLSVCTVSGNTVTIAGGGTCTVQATQSGDTNYSAAAPVSQSFIVTPASQTITFAALSNQSLASAPFAVSATSSSSLAVSFNSSTTSTVCTVSGNTVTLIALGACTVQATQSGNANYSAATPVSQSFTVTSASQSITFNALSNQAYGTAPFALTTSATSGLPVSFNSSTASVCTVSANTLTVVGVGTCTVQATQSGNATYSAATPVSQSFTVTPASQTITFAALSNQSLASSPFPISATSSSNLAVGFSSQTMPVCTVSGSTVTLLTLGTCTLQATQSGNANYSAASPISQSFMVTAGIVITGVNSLNFPNTVVGKSSAAQAFTLQNSGNTALTIASILPAGADAANYRYTADAVHPCPISPATLGAGATCMLDVAFAPIIQGSHNNAQIVITDNSGNVSGTTQSIAVTGTGIVLSSIAVSAGSASLTYSATAQFTATGTYSDNTTADLTGQVTWASSATGVATVSAGGLVTAVAVGQANIAATLGTVTSNNFQLAVLPGTAASISVSSGSGQSTTVGTSFGGLLAAAVKDSGGNAVANASVTFTAPSSGASATFSNSATTYTTTTNSSGIATSPALTANATAGSYSVTAAVTGVATAASFALTNVKASTLSVTESVTTFVQGQSSAFTLTVVNAANAGPTSGTLTVMLSLPSGLILTGLNGGSTWNCNIPTASCTTNAVLSPGSTSSIGVTVAVALNAQGPVSIGAGVSGDAPVSYSAPILSACSVSKNASISVTDVQQIVNQALGVSPPANDMNGDGLVNVTDLQIVLNAAMNQGCSAS